MNVIEKGRTRKIQIKFYDENDVLTDPTSPTITIYFENGTTTLTATALIKVTTGVYIYRWVTGSSNTIGKYFIEINATFGAQLFVNRDSILLVDIIQGD